MDQLRGGEGNRAVKWLRSLFSYRCPSCGAPAWLSCGECYGARASHVRGVDALVLIVLVLICFGAWLGCAS